MPSRDEILSFVKRKGTAIPNDIKKELGGDTFLIGAILSELVEAGYLKISATKIGGSPAYYTKGSEGRLLDLIKYLNEKDRRTVELLRNKKVLRDREQEMLVRVSIRNIKDFARQIDVKIKGEKELFWKWFLTPMEEAETLIKKHFPQPQVQTPIKQEKEEPARISKEEKRLESANIKNFAVREESQEVLSRQEARDDDFSKAIHEFFDEKGIVVIEENVIRKNSEIELKLKMPTAVGKVDYFCKAKNKKKCNDGDLSSAFLKGQMLKIPVLFLTTGEVTKKAVDMLEHEFKGMVMKRI